MGAMKLSSTLASGAVATSLLCALVGACGSGSSGSRGVPQPDASEASVCSAGDTRRCVGPGACPGGQECLATGKWSSCDCGTGGSSSGGQSSAGGAPTGGRSNGGVTGFGGLLPGGNGGLVIGVGGGGGGGRGGTDGGPDASLPPSVSHCTSSELDAFAVPPSVSDVALLYPYEGTVLPRGLPSPTVMWSQTGPADAVLVRVDVGGFSYEECLGATNPLRVTLTAEAWSDAEAWSRTATDRVTVSIIVRSGGSVFSPANVHLFIAPAALDAAVYYTSYNSPLAQGNGAVLRLILGQAQPTAFLTVNGAPPLGPCVGCHSVSANASVMTANTHTYPSGPFISASYDITGTTPTQVFNNLPEAGFAGIYPDGSLAMTNGVPNVTSRSYAFPDVAGAPVALIPYPTNSTSRLLDTKTGQVVTASGWTVARATMPMFSPDGKHLVYNDFDQGAGHSLWLADFDVTRRAFSNARLLYNDAQRYPGWPSFTPDSKNVVFTLGSRDDFASQVPDFNLPVVSPNQPAANGHLMMVSVAGGQAVALDLANGYGKSGSYLPKADNDRDFYPSVVPFGAGGFYWIVFTSRRSYGNLVDLDVNDANTKKIWMSAVDPSAPAGTDASRPAFFLPGQETGSANFRAVASHSN